MSLAPILVSRVQETVVYAIPEFAFVVNFFLHRFKLLMVL
jgi:hypothetical protein